MKRKVILIALLSFVVVVSKTSYLCADNQLKDAKISENKFFIEVFPNSEFATMCDYDIETIETIDNITYIHTKDDLRLEIDENSHVFTTYVGNDTTPFETIDDYIIR